MELQKAQKCQSNPEGEKKTKAGDITVPDFTHYYRATVIKTTWYWYKNIHTDQQNRIGGPEASPCARSQSICDKGGKNVWWRKDSLLSGAGETGQLYVKKKEIRTFSNTMCKSKVKMS